MNFIGIKSIFVISHLLGKEVNEMKRWVSLLLALALLAVFSFGCSGVARETKIKCPKCGAVFTVDEGLAQIQRKGD